MKNQSNSDAADAGDQFREILEDMADMAGIWVAVDTLVASVERRAAGNYEDRLEALRQAQFYVTQGNTMRLLDLAFPEPEFVPSAPATALEFHRNLVDATASFADRLRPLLVRLGEELGEDVDPYRTAQVFDASDSAEPDEV